MLIEFAPEILSTKDNLNKFMYLYNLCFLHRRYDFFIDLTEVLNSPIYESLSFEDKEVIEASFNVQATRNATVDFLITNEEIKENYVLNLDEAYAYLTQPLYIVLENSYNDRHFVNALIDNFSNKGKKIRRHLNQRFISYLNGGGCTNIKSVLEEKIEAFNDLPREGSFYFRGFVLIDSDSEYEGDIKQSRTDLKNYLDGNRIKYHFLTKREMENYLPEEVYESIADNQEYIAAYKRLTPIQKDYLDIENGFIPNVNYEAHYKNEIKDLFYTVSPADKNIFRADTLNIFNFKVEFPKLFKNAAVTQTSLQKRIAHQTNSNELGDILDKINNLL